MAINYTFEWDPGKAYGNKDKHDVAFEERKIAGCHPYISRRKREGCNNQDYFKPKSDKTGNPTVR